MQKQKLWCPAAHRVSWIMPDRTVWIRSLKALGDESRLRILGALMKRTFSVNELAAKLGLSQYNVSKHLRVLRSAGIVDLQVNFNRREYFIAEKFRKQLAKNKNVLDLGCCTFRFDQLPKK
ncbi:MAG: winged helix-turn-helix domain-containing protein [Chthoniobacterales bacterium]